MPGGGFGIFNGCTTELGTPSTGWGAQYGGISSRSQCDAFPEKLKAGCYWRFDWFQNADNPDITFKQVACPAALTAKSGCVRENDVINEEPTGSPSVPTWTSGIGTVPTSSSASTTKNTVSTTSTTIGTSQSTSTTSTAAAGTTSAAPSGPAVGMWGQCGGIGYLGSTQCVAGATCKFNSEYYSQCLPV